MRMLAILFCSLFFFCNPEENKAVNIQEEDEIVPGVHRMEVYLPLLEDKKVALVVNQTSMIEDTHLVDTLISRGVEVVKVFAPEHGFRGTADAGEWVEGSIDKKTGLPIVSLYGSNKKPTPAQLEDVDVIIFDIQDVGVRFYTYISTMHYMMEAAAENDKKFIVLDRPNPNGMYVDGPILNLEYQSFVGMHPIPIVHGLTVGELAMMINNEGWLAEGVKCDLEVVKMLNYEHDDQYSLPVKPSPNLPNDLSIALYPSLALFEGTNISVGRGTYEPFQQIGHPKLDTFSYTFEPKSIEGMSKYPPHEGKTVYGLSFIDQQPEYRFTLKYLLDMYAAFPESQEFFIQNNFFEKLEGTGKLREQIKKGMSEEQIRETWKEGLAEYKLLRKEYLLYPEGGN